MKLIFLLICCKLHLTGGQKTKLHVILHWKCVNLPWRQLHHKRPLSHNREVRQTLHKKNHNGSDITEIKLTSVYFTFLAIEIATWQVKKARNTFVEQKRLNAWAVQVIWLYSSPTVSLPNFWKLSDATRTLYIFVHHIFHCWNRTNR